MVDRSGVSGGGGADAPDRDGERPDSPDDTSHGAAITAVARVAPGCASSSL
jgi:hypothetical protein